MLIPNKLADTGMPSSQKFVSVLSQQLIQHSTLFLALSLIFLVGNILINIKIVTLSRRGVYFKVKTVVLMSMCIVLIVCFLFDF